MQAKLLQSCQTLSGVFYVPLVNMIPAYLFQSLRTSGSQVASMKLLDIRLKTVPQGQTAVCRHLNPYLETFFLDEAACRNAIPFTT